MDSFVVDCEQTGRDCIQYLKDQVRRGGEAGRGEMLSVSLYGKECFNPLASSDDWRIDLDEHIRS